MLCCSLRKCVSQLKCAVKTNSLLSIIDDSINKLSVNESNPSESQETISNVVVNSVITAVSKKLRNVEDNTSLVFSNDIHEIHSDKSQNCKMVNLISSMSCCSWCVLKGLSNVAKLKNYKISFF